MFTDFALEPGRKMFAIYDLPVGAANVVCDIPKTIDLGFYRDSFGPCWAHSFVGPCWAHSFVGPCWAHFIGWSSGSIQLSVFVFIGWLSGSIRLSVLFL